MSRHLGLPDPGERSKVTNQHENCSNRVRSWSICRGMGWQYGCLPQSRIGALIKVMSRAGVELQP